jgi:manganese-dependent inorganic pyrophosphatase
VELPHADPILEADDQYREAMAALRSEGYADVVLMVTDLNRDGSYLLVETANAEAYEDAFGIEAEAEGASFVPGILSRKKQVVPPLLDAVG